MTALIYASYEGHYDAVKVLLAEGADKEAKVNVKGSVRSPRWSGPSKD